LIFQELETYSCRGHKVMISAIALTVNFPVFAAGGPKRKSGTCTHPAFLLYREHERSWHPYVFL
jgi:hypothetical protein